MESPVLQEKFSSLLRKIDNLKESERQARHDSEKYRKLFEFASIGIGLADRYGNIIDYNDAILKPGNYQREDIKKIKNVSNLYYDPEDRIKILLKYKETGKIDGEEVQFVKKDGSPYFTALSLRPIKIDNQDYTLALVEDISQRKKTEEELKISERSYRELFDNSTDMLYILNKEGVLQDVNKTVIKNYGYSKKDIIGKTQGIFNAPGKNNLKAISKKLKLAWKGEPQYYNWWGRKKNGNIFPIEVVVRKGHYFSREVLIASARDVSERIKSQKLLREGEERLELALEGGSLGLWDWDCETDEIVFNNYWEQMLGFKSDEIDHKFNKQNKLIHPEDLERRNSILQKHLHGKNSYYECEYRIKTKSGKYKWILDRGKVTKQNKKGKPLRITGTYQDIDDRKKTEQKLQAMTENLKRYNYELKQFAYVISHNLKSPVSNLKSLLKLFDKSEIKKNHNELLFSKIEQSVNRLNSTLEDLSEILSTTKNASQSIEKINLERLLNEVKESIETQIKDSKAQISSDFKIKDIKYTKRHIENIFQNLLTNSIKYRAYERKLRIKLTSLKENGFIKLSVKDNGLGIDLDKYKDSLFGLYKRCHYHVEGKGMGLYLIKSQVESLGGKINVKSQVGKGSTFEVYLKELK